MSGTWFVINLGEDKGRAHLSGWMLAAIKGEDLPPRHDGWLSYATCPRCFAMVLADPTHPFGDQTWAHERWHAATDYPVPADIMARVTRP